MKLFLSWSMDALPVADCLRTWLPKVLPGIEPWMSPQIDAGRVGVQALMERIKECDGGLVVLTPYSQASAWVLFESGAFAHKGNFFPYVVGLRTVERPFSDFQFRRSDLPDTEKLVRELAESMVRLGAHPSVFEGLNDRIHEHWSELESVVEQVAVKAKKAASRAHMMGGQFSVLLMQTEKRAMEAEDAAKHHELRAESIKSLALPLLKRYEWCLESKGGSERLLEEAKLWRQTLESEEFGDFVEPKPYEAGPA